MQQSTLFKDVIEKERQFDSPQFQQGVLELVGMNLADLQDFMTKIGQPVFRAKQLWNWIYYQGVTDFNQMTNLPKDFRHALTEHSVVGRLKVTRSHQSFDQTQKWLMQAPDGNEIETVHIPEAQRGTLCISSQVGCTLTCRFCHTGTQLWVRNLTAGEIVSQMLVARDSFQEWPSPTEDRKISNIVMMGMGEPLFNYDNVAKALAIIMDKDGINFSKRKITLSTSGVVPMMQRCAVELGVNLAVSLHAVTNDIRSQIVPLNRKYPIEELLHACRQYAEVVKQRITFEYVMLKGVNDSAADARQLSKLLRNIPAKVNLIPFNPWPGAPFECSDHGTIQNFSAIVEKAGYPAPVRTPRGQDIMAACGQLKSDSERQRKLKHQDGGNHD